MNDKKAASKGIDWDLANAMMAKAVHEGRTKDDGWWDYLATLGITRPEEDEAFLRKFSEQDRKLSNEIRANLEAMRKLVHEIQKKYA